LSLVLDASVTLSWLFDEEQVGETEAVLDLVRETGALVPPLWHLEVANALLVAVRRGRMTPAQRSRRLADLGALAIDSDSGATGRCWDAALPLAERCRLTVYDATYLELALRHGFMLATLDGALRAAAEAEGLVVLGR